MKIFLSLFVCFLFLDASWQDLLKTKQHILKQNNFASKIYSDSNYSTVYSVLIVDNNIDDVWNDIKDFNSYPDKINSIDNARIYIQNKTNVGVVFTFSKFFITKDSYYLHFIDDVNYKMHWNLDNSKPMGIFKYSGGKWMLKKIDSNKTMVFYTNRVSVSSWVLDILRSYLLDSGAKESVMWLMRKS